MGETTDGTMSTITNEMRVLAEEVGRLYPAVYRRFHVSHQPMPGTDVTPRMLGVLHHLAAAGPLTLGELVLHLSLSKAATTELVDRLEARGLVARMHDDRDRRRVFIWLTDDGRARVATHPRVLEDELLAQALARMSAEDRTALVTGMRALLAASELSPVAAHAATLTTPTD
jgi:DNA-binding MarR family transcriptional regulator